MRDVLAFWAWVWDLFLSHVVGALAALVAGVVMFFGGAALTNGIDQLYPLSEDWYTALIVLLMSFGAIGAYLWSAVRVYGRRRASRVRA